MVVGGTSLAGGSGKIFGTLIGALIMAVIQNGMNLTGVESYRQKVVLGLVILGAVLLDMLKKRRWKFPRRRRSTSGPSAGPASRVGRSVGSSMRSSMETERSCILWQCVYLRRSRFSADRSQKFSPLTRIASTTEVSSSMRLRQGELQAAWSTVPADFSATPARKLLRERTEIGSR